MESGLDFCPDFGFAFNNRNFSDRILRIEIVAEKENGDEAAVSGDDSNGSKDGSTVLGVKTLYITSAILAAKSPFFYKLFTNGMMESEQRHVTLRINASEEAVLMELLNFMHSNTLRANTAPALLDLLVAADKFEVTSCMGHCSRVLTNLAFTPESALLYLNLPPTISSAEAVQLLMDAAKQFLVARYKDVSKHIDEIMNLPLAGIEVILSSDDLQVPSEDAVYEMALKWAEIHYQKPEERRDILSTRLGHYIRFPYMSPGKLNKVMMCDHFDRDFTTKAVMDALFFKADDPDRQRAHASHLFVERAYTYKFIKVVELEVLCQQCVVYLDLKREECAGLFPSGQICSHDFHLGGQNFFLSGHCYDNGQKFGVFLGMQEKGSTTISVDFELGFRSKPVEKYISKRKGNYVFASGKSRNLYGFLWTLFMADYSPYFINEVLHIRAELTVKR